MTFIRRLAAAAGHTDSTCNGHFKVAFLKLAYQRKTAEKERTNKCWVMRLALRPDVDCDWMERSHGHNKSCNLRVCFVVCFLQQFYLLLHFSVRGYATGPVALKAAFEASPFNWTNVVGEFMCDGAKTKVARILSLLVQFTFTTCS